MPFKSDAQRRWMYATHPQMAKRWQRHTPKGKDLPEHVKKSFYDKGRQYALGLLKITQGES
jgi:hypothetical protein